MNTRVGCRRLDCLIDDCYTCTRLDCLFDDCYTSRHRDGIFCWNGNELVMEEERGSGCVTGLVSLTVAMLPEIAKICTDKTRKLIAGISD